MVKTKFKKAVSLMLAAVMSLTAFTGIGATTAFAAVLRRNRSSNSCLRYERYRFCRQRPDYRSQQSVRFHLRSYPCHRSYPAWLRYRSGRSLFEVSRPVSESQRFPDSCRRYHHYLCKGNPYPYYRLREHSYQTGHTWHFRYAPKENYTYDRSSYIIAVYIKNGENGKLVPQVIAEKNDGKKYGELMFYNSYNKRNI